MLFIVSCRQVFGKCFMEIELKKTLIPLLATASIFTALSAANSGAQSTSSNLTVKAELTNGCSIVFNGDAETVDFGPITDLSSNVARERSFTIKCTNSLVSGSGADTNKYAPVSVGLNGGSVSGSTVDNRLMANADNPGGNNTLKFQVYQGRQGSSAIWGDQPSGANAVYPTPTTNATYPFTVVLLAQDISGKTTGTYSNTMVATVNYSAISGK